LIKIEKRPSAEKAADSIAALAVTLFKSRGKMLAPSTLAPQYLLSTLSTCSVFHYEHLQLLFHYLNCFSQHLAIKVDV
jgi:hypothetical protein